MPYAPLENVWSKVGGKEPFPHESQSCLDLKKVVKSFCPQAERCPNGVLGKQLEASVALAPELDKQLTIMWLAAYELGFPVITHASPAGAKQGSGFEKYGSLLIWNAFENDLRDLISKKFPTHRCEDRPVRVLLAHSGANEDFSNKGFTRMIKFLHRNWTRRGESCVDFYVDFSDIYLQPGEGKLNFDHLVNKNKYLQEDSEFRRSFLDLILNGRVLYGSDYFMSTLASGNDLPNKYLYGHSEWVNELDRSEGGNEAIKKNYLKSGSLKFLGLLNSSGKEDLSQACDRAKTWFKGAIHPWISSLCR